MERVFNDLEGLRIAVEMEKRGVELYRHAARVCKRPSAAALLKRLEQDEQAHQCEFAEHYERLRQKSEGDGVRHDEETAAYLSAVAADVVFPGGLIDLAREAQLDNPAGILRYAIQSERDSIRFYEEMAARAMDADERAVFSAIALREREHMQELTAMLTEEEP